MDKNKKNLSQEEFKFNEKPIISNEKPQKSNIIEFPSFQNAQNEEFEKNAFKRIGALTRHLKKG